MDYKVLMSRLKAGGLVGQRYQREGNRKFRDCVTVYRDGRLLFQRFCYGEAAGLVFSLWAEKALPDGQISWDYAACGNEASAEAPKCFTSVEGSIRFDEKQDSWQPAAALKSDPANGYGLMHSLALRMKR